MSASADHIVISSLARLWFNLFSESRDVVTRIAAHVLNHLDMALPNRFISYTLLLSVHQPHTRL